MDYQRFMKHICWVLKSTLILKSSANLNNDILTEIERTVQTHGKFETRARAIYLAIYHVHHEQEIHVFMKQ